MREAAVRWQTSQCKQRQFSLTTIMLSEEHPNVAAGVNDGHGIQWQTNHETRNNIYVNQTAQPAERIRFAQAFAGLPKVRNSKLEMCAIGEYFTLSPT
jgi:hypothetical protein